MTETPVPARPATTPLRSMLRSAILPTVAVGPVAIAIAAFVGGQRAAIGALLGYAVTLAFFGLGMIVMIKFATVKEPLIFMATAIAVFFGQLIFLLLVILMLQEAEWLDGRAFGLTALVVALVWQAFCIIGFLRARRPVYDSPAGA